MIKVQPGTLEIRSSMHLNADASLNLKDGNDYTTSFHRRTEITALEKLRDGDDMQSE